jgi:MFS family permease
MSPNYPSEGHAWRLTALLMVAGIFSYIDRQVLTVMTEFLHRDFLMSDTQIGVLIGFPFAIFFTLAGLPLARLVDAYDRLVVLAAGVTLWSLCTFASAFASDFLQLLTLRVGVAVGEATLSTMAYSVIADCFPKTRMGLPISAFLVSTIAGGALSLIVGGEVVSALADLHRVALPFGLSTHGWQLTFAVVGAPGLLIAVAALQFKDPTRPRPWAKGAATGAAKPGAAPVAMPLSEVLAYFRLHWRAYASLVLGVTTLSAVAIGAVAWAPAMFQRVYGWSPAKTGLGFGLTYVSFSILGTLTSGWLSDQVARRRGPAGRILLAVTAPLIVLVFALYPLAPTPIASLAMLSVLILGLAIAITVGPVGVQNITPPAFRGQATALYLLGLNLVGQGLGPLIVPLITDHVFHDRSRVGHSLSIAALVIIPLAVLVLWSGRKSIAAAVQAADAWAPPEKAAVSPT